MSGFRRSTSGLLGVVLAGSLLALVPAVGRSPVGAQSLDDPVLPEISITGGPAVTEGENAVFTLTASSTPLVKGRFLQVRVGYADASNDADFLEPKREADGLCPVVKAILRGNCQLSTTDDNIDEPNGTITATLKPGDGYTINSSASTASVTVKDDDDTTVTLSAPAGDMAEASGTKDFTATLGRTLVDDEVVTVPLTATGATVGDDFTWALQPAVQTGVSLLTASPHSPQNPALRLAAGASQGVVRLAAVNNNVRTQPSVTVGLGTSTRAPAGTNIDIAKPTGGPFSFLISDDETGDIVVPPDWSLIPSGASGGDTFRLLFTTSGARDATSADITDYDKFVWLHAAKGHASLVPYAGFFRVVGSTTTVDAHDHNDANPATDGNGEAIYWLDGDKVADDYADFWDNSWDDEETPTDEGGAFNRYSQGYWTGTDTGGGARSGLELGSSPHVRQGNPLLNFGGQVGPITGASAARSLTKPFYGLSMPFKVDSGVAVNLGVNNNGAVTEGGTLTITATLAQAAPSAGVTIPLRAVAGSTAVAADYTLSANSITIASGQTTGTVTLAAVDDDVDEPSQWLKLGLGTLPDGYAAGLQSSVVIDIADDDATPEIDLSVDTASVSEGDGATTVTVTATIDHATIRFDTDRTVVVSVGASGTSGVVGFEAVNDFDLTIAAGAKTGTATFTLTPQVDSINEDDETIKVSGSHGGVTVNSATLDLSDDDSVGVVISKAALSVAENGGTATYTVVLNSQPIYNVKVTVTSPAPTTVLLDGPADAAEYTTSEELLFTAKDWSTARTITVQGQNDDVDNPADKRSVTLTHDISSQDPKYSALADKMVVVAVVDDDATVVTLSRQDDVGVLKEGQSVSFHVRLSRPLVAGETLKVPVVYSGATLRDSFRVISQVLASGVAKGTFTSVEDAFFTFTGPTSGSSIGIITLIHQADNNAVDETLTVSVPVSTSATPGLVATGFSDGVKGTGSFSIVLDDSADNEDISVQLLGGGVIDGSISSGDGSETEIVVELSRPLVATETAEVELVFDHKQTFPKRAWIVGGSATGKHLLYYTWSVSGDGVTSKVSNPSTSNKKLTVIFTGDATDTVQRAVLNFVSTGQETSSHSNKVEESSDTEHELVEITANPATSSVGLNLVAYNDDDPATLGDVTTRVLITDDDATDWQISFTDTDDTALTAASVTEGDDFTFNVTLPDTVTGPVTVPLTYTHGTSSAADFDALPTSVFIPYGAESATVTISTVNDSTTENDETLTINAGTAPPGFTTTNTTFTLNINDNDGITITETSGSTSVTENGGTGTYTVVLDSQPSADVTITITSDTPTAAVIDGPDDGDTGGTTETLTFTSTNWDTAQTVTVTGVNDNLDNTGNQRTVTLTHAVTSDDVNYAALADKMVAVTVVDDDVTVVTLSRQGDVGVLKEGQSVSFHVRLSRALVAGETLKVPVVFSGATLRDSFRVISQVLPSGVAKGTFTSVEDAFFTFTGPTSGSSIGIITLIHRADSNAVDETLVVSVPVSESVTPGLVATGFSDGVKGAGSFSIVLDDSADNEDISVRLSGGGVIDGSISSGDGSETEIVVELSRPLVATETAEVELVFDHKQTFPKRAWIVGGSATGKHLLYYTWSVSGDGVTSKVSNPSTSNKKLTVIFTGDATDTVQRAVLNFVSTGQETSSHSNKVEESSDTEHELVEITANPATSSVGLNLVAYNDDDPATLGDVTTRVLITDDDATDWQISFTDTDDTALTAASVTEGDDFTFNVTLPDTVTGPVTVPLTYTHGTSSAADFDALPTSVFIPYGAESATVTISTVNDSTTENDETLTINAGTAPPGFTTTNTTFTLTLTDDDSVGVTITESSGSTSVTENAGTDTYSVVLDSQPTADVTITVTSDTPAAAVIDGPDAGDNGGTTETLTFTTTNWASAQTITVTGVNDNLDNTGNERTATLTHAVASTDTKYNTITDQTVSVTVTDDDATPEIDLTVNPTSVNEDDGATKVTVTATIDHATTRFDKDRTVVVSVDGSGGSGVVGFGAVTDFNLTITAGAKTGTATFELTPQDDSTDETNETITVSGTLTGLTINSATLSLVDDDGVGVTITQSSGSTSVTENAGTDTYTVVLDSQPTHSVTVTITSGTPTAAVIDGPDVGTTGGTSETLTFTTTNWASAQTITVTGVNDNLDNTGNERTATLTHAVASTDTKYNTITDQTVSVTVTDDDATPEIDLTINPVSVSEDDGATKVTVTATIDHATTRFDKDRTVVVSVDGSGGSGVVGFGAVTDFNLTITAGAKTGTATFELTPQNDSTDETNETITVSGTLTGLTINSATLSLVDDDGVGVTITQSSGSTSVTENAGTDTYSVVLDSQPTADVTVTVTSDTPAAAVIDGPDVGTTGSTSETLTFTTTNWASAQTVTVTGVNDNLDNTGDERTATLTHAVTSSDTKYNTLSDQTITVTVTDDDATPEIDLTINPVSVSEDDDPTTITVTATIDHATTRFDTDRTVVVSVDGSGGSGVVGFRAVNDFNLTITAGAKTGTATFELTPQNDSTDETNETITVSGTLTGLTINSATLSLVDDDGVGVTITQSSGSTSVTENAGTDTYSVVLDSQPTADVTITVTSDTPAAAVIDGPDAGDNGGTTETLTFTTTNWASAQTITVTGVNDNLDNTGNERTATLTHAVTSTDTKYNTITDQTVTVTVTDDDATPEIDLTINPVSVNENDDPTTITVTATIDHATTRFDTAKTVRVTVTGPAGAEFVDFTPLNPFNLTIASGVALGTASFSLVPTDDNVNERDATVTVAGSLTGVTVNSTTLVLRDDESDPTLSQPAPTAPNVTEGTAADFVITASLASSFPITVNVRVSETNSGDYVASSNEGDETVTLPAGDTRVAYSVPTVQDSVEEPDGSVTLALRSGSGYSLSGTTSRTVNIADDDAVPVVAVDLSIDNNGAVTEGGTLAVTATLAEAATTNVTIPVRAAAGGTAATNDYSLSATSITVTSGSTSGTLTLTATDDSTDELTETLTLELGTLPTGYTTGTATSVVVTIADNDPTSVTLSRAPGTLATEGTSVPYTVALSRSLTAGESLEVPLTVSNSDESAARGTDYTLECPTPLPTGVSCSGFDDNGMTAEEQANAENRAENEEQTSTEEEANAERVPIVTFTGSDDAAAKVDIILKVLVDRVEESDGETVDIGLGALSSEVTATDNATPLILSDTSSNSPVVSLSYSGATTITEGQSASFTVTADPAPASDIRVQLHLLQSQPFGGRITGGDEVVLTPSEPSATVTVTTVDDKWHHPDGSLTLVVLEPATRTSYQLHHNDQAPSAQRVLVADNDPPSANKVSPRYFVRPNGPCRDSRTNAVIPGGAAACSSPPRGYSVAHKDVSFVVSKSDFRLNEGESRDVMVTFSRVPDGGSDVSAVFRAALQSDPPNLGAYDCKTFAGVGEVCRRWGYNPPWWDMRPFLETQLLNNGVLNSHNQLRVRITAKETDTAINGRIAAQVYPWIGDARPWPGARNSPPVGFSKPGWNPHLADVNVFTYFSLRQWLFSSNKVAWHPDTRINIRVINNDLPTDGTT